MGARENRRQRAIEGGVRCRAVPVAPLSLAKGDGRSDLGGEPARQILSRDHRVLVAAEPVEESQEAVAERGVARRERLGLLRRRQRALQIAQLLADLAQQIPFDRTWRLGHCLGERPQRSARPRHLPRAGPGGTATLRRGTRDLPHERPQSFVCPRRLRGIAIGETQARRSKNERELGEQVMGGNALFEDGGCFARSPRARERLGQLLGRAIALGREACELPAEPDDLLGIAAAHGARCFGRPSPGASEVRGVRRASSASISRRRAGGRSSRLIAAS